MEEEEEEEEEMMMTMTTLKTEVTGSSEMSLHI